METTGTFATTIRENGAPDGTIDRAAVVALFREFEEGAKQFRGETVPFAGLVGHDEAVMLKLACELRGIMPELDNFQVRLSDATDSLL